MRQPPPEEISTLAGDTRVAGFPIFLQQSTPLVTLLILLVSETGSYTAVQASLESVAILLSQSPDAGITMRCALPRSHCS